MGLDKFLTPNNHGCCNKGLDWNSRYQHYFVELLFNVAHEILNIDKWGAMGFITLYGYYGLHHSNHFCMLSVSMFSVSLRVVMYFHAPFDFVL